MRYGLNGWVAALAPMGAMQAAQAYKVPCNCSVYLSDTGELAVVIDNETGAVDGIAVRSSHTYNPDAPFGLVARNPGSTLVEMSDCGGEGIACAAFHRVVTGAQFAFKPGAIGDTYKVGDVSYTISRIAPLPHRGSAKIYTINVTGGVRSGGGFVYSDSAGIVRFSIRPDYWVNLVDGPGLLSPSGFPAAKKR
jgi:hypothetical protein